MIGKALALKPVGLESAPTVLRKKLGIMMGVCKPRGKAVKTDACLGAPWAVSLAQSVSSSLVGNSPKEILNHI